MNFDEFSPTWLTVKKWAEKRRNDYVEDLIEIDNEQTRGAVKILNELLRLPDTNKKKPLA